MPRFSVIVVHYQGAIPHDIFCRGVRSVLGQTYRDFEILCYHDGPLLEVGKTMPVPVRCTQMRHNDWGHSLRDIGIREATGDYIVHFNADNVLYPNALEMIAREIEREPRWKIGDRWADNNDVIVFPIYMFGMQRFFTQQIRAEGRPDYCMILTGNPPVRDGIDAMQLVMKRSRWLEEGGWKDKSVNSDANMYPGFAEKYGYRGVGTILGEHH